MKNRNLFLYCLAVLAVAFSFSTIQPKQTIYLPSQVITPMNGKNTIFLWDFHDVIAQRNIVKTFLAVWNSDKKFTILRNINLRLLGKLFGMAGRSLFTNVTAEELVQLIKQNNNPEFEKLIIDVANIQEPIIGTTDLIHDLHQLGYQHFIGSNIGATMFADIINPQKYPQFAPLFADFNLTHPQTVTFDFACPACTIRKPDIRFYQFFLERNAIDLAKTNVIFIDDRIKNVIAAQKAGLIGILFVSPEQLKANLEELGVFIPSSPPVDFRSQPVV